MSKPCEACGAAYTEHARDCTVSPGGPPPMAAPKPVAPPAQGTVAPPPAPPLVTSSPAMGVRHVGFTGATGPCGPSWSGSTAVAINYGMPPRPARKFDRHVVYHQVAGMLWQLAADGLIVLTPAVDVDRLVTGIMDAMERNL